MLTVPLMTSDHRKLRRGERVTGSGCAATARRKALRVTIQA